MSLFQNKTLMITGSGSLTGKESFWSDYAGYFAKVYVQKGINGFTSCVDKKTFTSAGKETVEEVEYDTYAVSNRIIYNANGGVDVPLDALHVEECADAIVKALG